MIQFARFSIPGIVVTLAICDTLLLLGCYMLAAQGTQTADLDTYLFSGEGLLKITIVVTSLELGLFWERLYESVVSPVGLLQHVCVVVGAAFLLQALLSYTAGLELDRGVMFYGSALILVIFPLWRIAFSAVLRKAVPKRRLLFLGASPETDRIMLQLKEHPETDLSVLGYLDSATYALTAVRLGSLEDFEAVVQQHSPQRIVIGTREGGDILPVRRLLEMQWNGAQVEEATMLYESLTGRVSIFSIDPSRLIFSSEFDPTQPALTLQGIYCLMLMVLLIGVSSPIILLTALLVKISSRGPLLTRERRVGLGGSPMEMFFFRTTAASGDVTAVGCWLRRLHLDKLPLLFNIARGELSLVGPQPERPEFAAILEKNIPFYRHRHSVKPGLTGWAQIHVKDTGGLKDTILKLEYDFFYIKNLAALLDIHILLRTLSG